MERRNPVQPHPLATLLCMVSILLVSATVQAASSIKTDAEALIAFKNMISKDPNGAFSSWQPNKDPCTWYGVTCSSSSLPGRLTQLDLSGSDLIGSVSLDPFRSLDTLSVLKLSSNSLLIINSTSLLQLPYGLAQLDLSFAGVLGPVPEGLFSACPNLVDLNLSFNNLTGSLPENFLFGADKLRNLDLSYNDLSGSASGLRIERHACSSLLQLDLSGNHLTSSIPFSLSNCTNLQTLNLGTNLFTGAIPKSFGQLTNLQRMDLSHNNLTGWIPVELGSTCKSLLELTLSYNNISGPIPASFSSCTWLQTLDLSNNIISGPFPELILQNMTALESLLLSKNVISGPFPVTISYCKKLGVLDLSSNKFSGIIPPGLCPAAASLEELRVPDNLINGKIPPQLSECSQLKKIDFSLNNFVGPIPAEFGKLQNLEQLIAWFNGLDGTIPPELGNCKNLKNLILNNNHLSGGIPVDLFKCSNLEWVSLTSNELSGEIPREFGLLSRLAVLQLGHNRFSGEIPSELENCSSMVWLDLNSNKLTGQIPPRLGRQIGAKSLNGILSGNTLVFVRNVGNSCSGIGGLLEFAGIRPEKLLQVPTLKSCDFTRMYSGPILSLFTRYQTLEYLDLSYNELHGKIPDEMGQMIALQVLDISHNQLSGEIPFSLGNLKNLGVFDASHNRLQGQIPDSFSNLSFLVQIDLSNNDLTGQIPQRGQLSTLPASQFANNPGLCGVPLPECKNYQPATNPNPDNIGARQKHEAVMWANNVVLGILVSIAFACILIVWAVVMRIRQREAEGIKMLSTLQASHAATTWKIEREKDPLSINVATFQRQLRKLKFSQLIEATDHFSASTLIGSGGFGEVFKATLKDGSHVAIKKLVRLSCQGDREFMAEMETLGKIKHRNLVPLLGYCKVGEERLLVYEFMEFGSLEEVLHGRTREHQDRQILTWAERKKIARGAAKGLCFLHHNCIPHIIHRDLKSSNVLLDRDMEARISDFGMARLISALDTHLSVSTLAGTPGYVPPEYYQSFRCTAKGDVYSLGVVLLELLTGRRPTDKEDFGDTNLVGWVRMKVREGKQNEVIDPILVAAARGSGDEAAEADEIKEMVRYMEISMQCAEEFPSRRPNMLQVVAMLRELSPGSAAGSSSSS